MARNIILNNVIFLIIFIRLIINNKFEIANIMKFYYDANVCINFYNNDYIFEGKLNKNTEKRP